MDLADVNGHVFVNNVSLGLYAAIVRSAAYRDAKVDTTLATLPQVLGPESEPFDLRFTGPDGVEHRGAHIIQISNNPYGTRSVAGEPASDGHPPARRRGVGAGQGAGRRRRPSWPPSRPAIRSASRGSRRGRHRRSRSRPTPRSRWGSTGRPRSWTRRCGSRSARPRSGCDCRSTPSATRRPPARSAGENRRANSGESSSATPASSTAERCRGSDDWDVDKAKYPNITSVQE